MKKHTVILIIFTLLFGTILSPQGNAETSAPEIIIRDTGMTSGENVLLGDIATLQGELSFVKDAKNIVLGRAPFPGRDRTFSKSQIITRLRQNDIDIRTVNFTCPPEVTVLSDYIELSREQIEKEVSNFIYRNMPWKRNWVRIDNFNHSSIRVPRGNLSFNITPRSGNNFIGRMAFEVDICVNGSQNYKTSVSALITVVAPVVKSAKTIQRHEIIGRGDLVIRNDDITYQTSEIVFDKNEIIGKRARTRIQPDTMLRTSMFEEHPVIQRGDIVTIFVETDSFRITTSGRALEDGYEGRVIMVSNLNSNNRLYGVVRNGNQVEVKIQ